MTLGEKIYTLRNRQKLSQGDLAEKLDVSRQSVSKWETDSSIPELDKLIQLSQIFGITLDELAKNQDLPEEQPSLRAEGIPQPAQEGKRETRKIVGTILLCFGGLVILMMTVAGGLLAGLIFALPLLLCGGICLGVEKNTGLWCGWAVTFLVFTYLRFAAGLSWQVVFFTFQYGAHMNYVRLIVGWVLLLWRLGMIAVTVLRFRKVPLVRGAKQYALLAGWGAAFVLTWIPVRIENLVAMDLYFYAMDWLQLAAVTVLLTSLARWLHSRKEKF